MYRASGLAMAKGMEVLLIVTLWNAYGQVRSLSELMRVFCAQPELSQIGTLACVIAIVGILAWTVTTLAEFLGNVRKKLCRENEASEVSSAIGS
jgi:hypothetical protein